MELGGRLIHAPEHLGQAAQLATPPPNEPALPSFRLRGRGLGHTQSLKFAGNVHVPPRDQWRKQQPMQHRHVTLGHWRLFAD